MPDTINHTKNYLEKTFKELALSQQAFVQKEFDDCTFSHCNFSEVQFTNCRFTACEFKDCNMGLIQVNDCTFIDCIFERCKIIGVNWTQAAWPQIKLCSPLQFFNCVLNYSSFLGLYLKEIVIMECEAHDVDFREANLTHADLSYSDFSRSQFVNTDLSAANFCYADNYAINVLHNKIKGAKFTLPAAVNLLAGLGIELVEP